MGEESEKTKRAVQSAMRQHSKLVVGDDHKRQQECMKAIQDALARYDCALVPRALLSQQGVEFVIETHAIPRDAKVKENASQTGQVSKKGKGQSGRKRKKR